MSEHEPAGERGEPSLVGADALGSHDGQASEPDARPAASRTGPRRAGTRRPRHEPATERAVETTHPDELAVAMAGDTWDLHWFVTALSRRRWWAAGAVLGAVGCALAYLMTATPMYVARAKLLIESQTPNVVTFKEVVEQNTTRLDYYETQLGIMRSRTLARSTIDQLNLWGHPELGPSPSVADRLVSAATRLWRGNGRPEPTDLANAESRVIDKFLNRVRIAYRADNRLVDVGYQSRDPKLAADVANALVQRYIQQNLELRVQTAREASIWLNQRLAEQQRRVQESEVALQQYRSTHADVVTSQRQNVTAQRLAELSSAATRARTDRISAEALLQEIQRVSESPATDATPLSAPNPVIQQLRQELMSLQRQEAELAQQLGSLHPSLVAVRTAIGRVEAQLNDETARLTQSLRREVEAARSREGSLAAALAAQEQVTLTLDRRGMQFDTLQREVESNRQLFEALRDRAKQTEISSELKIANVQIIDPAEVPRQPYAPRTMLVLALALLLGVPLACGTAFAIEYTDTRIKSPEDVRPLLGVDFVGFAPRVPGKGDTRRRSSIGEATEFAEAVRTIRTNVLVAVSRRGPKSLVVTSTHAGEGKTVIAANLAIALAQAGRRVVLVDADMRKSQVHDLFEMAAEPGLAGVLERTVPVQDALRASTIPGLTVLTAGSPRSSPGDLLAQQSVTTVLAPLPDSIDWIVVDTPPVRAASDAIAVAQHADAVLFVVGPDTNWRGARSALHELFAAGVNVLGAVISCADMDRMPSEYAFDYSYHEQGSH